MTLVEEETSRGAGSETEALFPEARRRRRRIRLASGLILAVVAIAIGGVVYGMGGHDAPPKAPKPAPVSSAPNELTPAIAIRSTEGAATAEESWRTTDGYSGCYPTLTGNGIIDLVHPSAAITVTESGCLPGGPVGTDSYRAVQVGNLLFQTDQPHEAGDFPPGKSWLKIPPSAMDLAHLATDEPLLVLNAVRGSLHRIGTAYIRGVATTEYQGSATLKSLQAATNFVNYGPFGTPDPPLDQIPIHIKVWLDAANRVRQITTWQPQYTLYFTDGSSEGGPYVVRPTTAKPKGPPRQQGYMETTLDLWRFGTPARISPPPVRAVAQPK